MNLPEVKLSRGIHVLHLFYRIDREAWGRLDAAGRGAACAALEGVCARNREASSPRLLTYANVGGKADVALMAFAATLGELSTIQRDVETAFPAGTIQPVYTYLSVTELPEYVTTEDDMIRQLTKGEKLEPGTPEFEQRLGEMRERHKEYERFRLYPELPDWEVMCFYPMSKKRRGGDNWYSLDFPTRKQLMAGHARTGRRYAGRISQLITGSTGLDDWEWGVTLMAHQTDAVKEIVYEMRFDEVSARFGEFGAFYINLRLDPGALWEHLRLG